MKWALVTPLWLVSCASDDETGLLSAKVKGMLTADSMGDESVNGLQKKSDSHVQNLLDAALRYHRHGQNALQQTKNKLTGLVSGELSLAEFSKDVHADTLKDIIELIQKIEDDMQSDHEDDENKITEANANYQKCITNFNNNEATTNASETEWRSEFDKHEKCRKEERTLDNDMRRRCIDLMNLENDWSSHKVPSGSNWISAFDTTERTCEAAVAPHTKKFEDFVEDFHEKALLWREKSNACSGASAKLVAQQASCAQLQLSAEAKICAWRSAVYHNCYESHKCQDDALPVFANLGVENRVVLRKEHFRSTQLIKCLVEDALGGSKDTDHCKAQVVDENKFGLTVPPEPKKDESHCELSRLARYPGSSSWAETYQGSECAVPAAGHTCDPIIDIPDGVLRGLPKCEGYTCPANHVLKASTSCSSGSHCGIYGDTADACCEEAPTCDTYTCPVNHALKANPELIHCAGAPCSSDDTNTCCKGATVLQLDATAGCPVNGGDCTGWFTYGCGAHNPTGCDNNHVYNPLVTALPTTERSNNRWWTGGGCGGGVCSDVWAVWDLHQSATVTKINFLNYQDSYGAKQLRISMAENFDGPYIPQQTFDGLHSTYGGSYGDPSIIHRADSRNHCCPVPDVDLLFEKPATGRFVKIEILKNHGSGGTGFYRVKFYGW